MKSAKHTLTVKASTDHLVEVRNFSVKQAKRCGFTKKQIHDIRLAVDEAFTNVIEHAYKNDGHQEVALEFDCSHGRLVISMFDTGHSFSIEDYQDPDIKEKVENKQRGGVGVYLIKELMDKIEYLHGDDYNELRMIKKR